MLIRLAALIVLTVGSTLIHGQLSQRWSLSKDFQLNDELVLSFPKEIGTWKYVNDGDAMSNGVIAELGVTEYVSRVYTNGTNSVTLLLMAGKTGHLIRHSPEICYGATGNTFLKEPTTVTLEVDGRSQEFRVLPVRPSSDLTGDFVVVYGYAHDGEFQSPANPRFVYHGLPAIEKIQVLCTSDPEKLGEIPAYAHSFVEEVCRYVHTNGSQK